MTSAPSPDPCFAVIAGGGTAGHVSPGLAIARALVDRGQPPGALRWIGSARGLEVGLVPAAGFPLDALGGRGVQRSLRPKAILDNIAALAGLAGALVHAFVLLRRYRPRVVLVLGGYASAPCVAASVVLRIPLVVTEQNARAGLANRIAGRFAQACAVPFTDTDLPRAVVTGNPVRDEILAVDRTRDRGQARKSLGLPADAIVIGVYSGSLGSVRINEAVAELAHRWVGRTDVAIRHVIGRNGYSSASIQAGAPGTDALHYQVVEYEDRVDLLLAAADLVVSRAGGNAVAELAQVGIGSILVPFPSATRDHQTANAAALVSKPGLRRADRRRRAQCRPARGRAGAVAGRSGPAGRHGSLGQASLARPSTPPSAWPSRARGCTPVTLLPPTGWPTPVIDLGTPTSVHLVGVGGAGISAIGTVLVARWATSVTGADVNETSA